MEWVETTAGTVAEAVELALRQLGVAESDAEILVLEEPKSALFGLRKSGARVRARVRPVQARAKRPNRRQPSGESRRRQSGPRSGDRPASNATSDGSGTGEGAGRPGRGRSRRSRSSGAGGEGPEAPRSSQAAASKGDDPGGSEADRGPRSSTSAAPRSRNRRRSGSDGAAARRPRQESNEEEEMSIESQAELAEAFVRGVVERFGLEATTSSEIAEDIIRVNVDGEGLGLLVGPRGSTVDALQELTRTAVQRRSDEHGGRIMVDVGGYRSRRAAALQQFTKRVAAEVLESGEAQALDPMSASDRKVVHDTVNEIEGLATTSEGDDPRRYVVIRPQAASEPAASEPAASEPAPLEDDDELSEG
ncbi:MAG: RNA-binding cell elongation regulator Jag/EloR [Acidimicrobiales bacterium]